MFDLSQDVDAFDYAARLLAQLLEFRLLLLLQHLLLLLQECDGVAQSFSGSLATAAAGARAAAAQPQFVQLPLQLALLLVQRLHFHKQLVALLVDLDWLVFDQLGQFLLGERLVEVLPEFLVLLGQAVDFLVLALLVLLQLGDEAFDIVAALLGRF